MLRKGLKPEHWQLKRRRSNLLDITGMVFGPFRVLRKGASEGWLVECLSCRVCDLRTSQNLRGIGGRHNPTCKVCGAQSAPEGVAAE